ncbi:hypothetical protein KCU90_g3932, partial [Aureobasidium melanogenum]
MDPFDAQRAIATLHSFRFFGLVFILPGVVSPDLPASFAVFAAYGDFATGVLAMLALLTTRVRSLFWLFVVAFNLMGVTDLIVDYYNAIQADLPAHAGEFGATVNRKEGMKMTRVRVQSFTISLDGYGAGPNQDINNPLGVGGTDLHQWLVPTRTFQRTVLGADGGTTGTDDDFAARGFKNVGAWILGRNMFGPIRGSWPDMNWKGWWGDNPPYHVPTFILTHHARAPIQMEGGTTFHFVTGGIHEALERAREAANGMDVRIGGGASTIQQYLRAGLIDELHFAISPVLLGAGERLFEGVDARALGYECVEFVATEKATHVVLRRQGHNDA